MWQTLRTVVEDHAAQLSVDQYATEFTRFNEAWNALKWFLARSGDKIGAAAEPAKPYRLYVQAADPLAKTPEIWVVYSVTPNEIIIHDVKAFDGSQVIH